MDSDLVVFSNDKLNGIFFSVVSEALLRGSLIMADPVLADTLDLKPVLDHTRGQFQYHAKQRLDSIRYFIASYGIFLAGYLSVATKIDSPAYQLYSCLLFGLTALIITLIFWGLDFRNAQMVNHNEAAMLEIEMIVKRKYMLSSFPMTETWEQPHQKIRKYRFLVNLLFAYFTLLSGGGTAFVFFKLICAP